MFRGLGGVCVSQSRPRARFFSFLSFNTFEDNESIPIFEAHPKGRRLTDVQLAELRARGRTPIVVMGRAPTVRRNPINIHGSIATSSIMHEFKRGELRSRVYGVSLAGKRTLYATVGHYYHEGAIDSPMFVLFNEFVPGARTKIQLPVRVVNADVSAAIRKGADFRFGDRYVDFYWRGDHKMPKAITLNLEFAAPELEFQLAQDAGVLPEGLTLRRPKRIHRLGSLYTTRQYEGLAEEVDPEAVAEAEKAEADKAAKAAAAKAAKAPAGDAKAGDAKAAGGDAKAAPKKK